MRELRHSHARLAQSVERWTLNPTVVGSSPTLGEYFFLGIIFTVLASGDHTNFLSRSELGFLPSNQLKSSCKIIVISHWLKTSRLVSLRQQCYHRNLPKNQKFKQETTLLYHHHKNKLKRILLKRRNEKYTVKLFYIYL